MWGKEDDLIDMKQNGSTGDFIVYEKLDEAESPLRVAFLRLDEGIGDQMRAQKIRVTKTDTKNFGGKGFGMKSTSLRWYDSIPKMIHYIKNDTNHILTKPYFYNSSDSCPSLSCPPSCPPSPPLLKSNGISNATPIPESNAGPPNGESQEGKPWILEDSAINGASTPSKMTLDGDGIKIIENRENVECLIQGKPIGTYVIHRGHRNTVENPYTIYAVKYSKREARECVIPARIYYYPEDQSY